MLNYNKCGACRKKKLFVKRRRVFIQPLNQYGTSLEPQCRKCAKIINKIKKEQ